MKYKSTIRIPTEQYAYVEIEVEGDAQEILDAKNELTRVLLENGEGLNLKEWAEFRNEYMNTGEINLDKWERCNTFQKQVINEIKKYYKSLK